MPVSSFGIEVRRLLRHHVAGGGHVGQLVEARRAHQDGGRRLAACHALARIGLVPSVGEAGAGGDIVGRDAEPVAEDRDVERGEVEGTNLAADIPSRRSRSSRPSGSPTSR